MVSTAFRRAASCLLALAVAFATLPVLADVREGSFELELYGGWYDPGPDVLPGEPTLGGRFGYNATPRFFVQGALGYTEFERSVAGTVNSGTIQLDLWNLDFSFGYNFLEESNITPEVHAGFGGGFASASGAVQSNDPDLCGGLLTCTVSFENLADESFTLHGGVGVRIDLGELVYLRPVVQTRWFAARDDDQWDPEYSVSLGFKVGGN